MRIIALAAAAALAVVSTASAASTYFSLSDHPDGNANPPGYGIRLDGLFAGEMGAAGGVTTFSFDTIGNTVLEVVTSGMSMTINITGTVYGGEDTGAGYGFGEGSYELSMSYTVGVVAQGTGYVVTAADASNSGSLTALSGDVAGTVYQLRDFSTPSFRFLQDDHRLNGHPEDNMDFWVGRGWLADENGVRNTTRDFLFLGSKLPGPPVVPLPASAGLGLVGMGLLGGARRRR